jgi:hypothetical protein
VSVALRIETAQEGRKKDCAATTWDESTFRDREKIPQLAPRFVLSRTVLGRTVEFEKQVKFS